MRNIYLISIILVLIGCSNSQKDNKVRAEKIGKLQVSLTEGPRFVSGQEIRFQCTTEDGNVPDSITVNFDNRRFGFVGKSEIVLPTIGISMGQHTIRINAKLADGSKAEGRAHVRILSDIQPEQLTYKVIKQIPHNSTFYTQGLEFDGDYLYEGTGIEGRSALYKIDFRKQKLVNSTSLSSNYFGEGVTILGEKVYQLTWQSFIGFVYNKNTLNKIADFDYSTEGWGLANNGSQLIMSDGSEKIYFIDTVSLQEVRRIEVYDNNGPITMLNELEYADGMIYANIYCSDYIVAIDPETGKVLKFIDMRGLLDNVKLQQHVDVLNGIAYHKQTEQWYVTGKLWPKIFQVEFVKK